MKKIAVRSIFVALLLAAVAFFAVWFFMKRREVPEQARVIPKDAFVVLTLNLRELALDHSGDEHLYPEFADEGMVEKELEPFTRALQANGGTTGMNETADVLAFAYHSGEAAFIGVAVQLDDSAAFGTFMRTHMAAEYNIVPWSTDGIPILRFDTSAAAIGWSEDAALVLYPIGHHGIATVSTQCAALLKQSRENSVLADDNFCNHERESFDAAVWIQTRPLLNFTGGGAQVQQLVSDIHYINYFTDFDDGEIRVRSEWHLGDDAVKGNYDEVAFPCDSKDILGFHRHHINVENDTMLQYYADAFPVNELPLNDEEAIELLPALTGDCISLTHDTVTFYQRHLSFDFDADFNRITLVDSTLESAVTRTATFKIADHAKAFEIITKIMERDSVPLTNRGWVYKESGLESRMILTDELLTVTTSPLVDGRSHPIPAELSGFMMWYDLQKIFSQRDAGLLGWFIPAIDTFYDEMSAQCVTLSNTLPVQYGDVRRSEVVLSFRNAEINSLIQAEEILRKIYFSNK